MARTATHASNSSLSIICFPTQPPHSRTQQGLQMQQPAVIVKRQTERSSTSSSISGCMGFACAFLQEVLLSTLLRYCYDSHQLCTMTCTPPHPPTHTHTHSSSPLKRHPSSPHSPLLPFTPSPLAPDADALTLAPAGAGDWLLQVFKDFLQVLSILQLVLHGWQSAAAAAMSSLSFTPLSTKAWISLDCILPRTPGVASHRQMYNMAAQVLLPGRTAAAAAAAGV